MREGGEDRKMIAHREREPNPFLVLHYVKQLGSGCRSITTEDSCWVVNVFSYTIHAQTVDNRAPPLLFASFSPLTVTFPKLSVILRPLYQFSRSSDIHYLTSGDNRLRPSSRAIGWVTNEENLRFDSNSQFKFLPVPGTNCMTHRQALQDTYNDIDPSIRRRSAAAWLLGPRVRIPLGACLSVVFICCVVLCR
jgi:hypothetical protein